MEEKVKIKAMEEERKKKRKKRKGEELKRLGSTTGRNEKEEIKNKRNI